MAKDDILLPFKMGKLEIETVKNNTSKKLDNPFIISQERKHLFTHKLSKYSKCTCTVQKRDITIPIYKKRNSRILKESTLKLLPSSTDNSTISRIRHKCIQSLSRSKISVREPDNINLHALVNNCNQLKISPELCVGSSTPTGGARDTLWWRQDYNQHQSNEAAADKTRAGPSCSQQALHPPCDVTIDELASYFETLVHIPKKMSSMAEMMYI